MGNSASLPSLESIGRPFGTERPSNFLSLRRHAERQTESRDPVERLEREVRPGGRRRTRKQDQNNGRRGSRGARPEEVRAEREAESRPSRRSQEAESRTRATDRAGRLQQVGRSSQPSGIQVEGGFGRHLRARAENSGSRPQAGGVRPTASRPAAEAPAPAVAPVQPQPLPATPLPGARAPQPPLLSEGAVPASGSVAAATRGPAQALAPGLVRPALEAGARATATPESGPTAEQAEAQEARRATQVLQQVRMHLHPGLRSATVQLHPAELGRLAIRVSVEESGVLARVSAESEEALAVLQRHVPELEAAFADQGFGELEFEFVLDQESGSQSGTPAEGRDVSQELERRLEADPDHQNPPRAASNGVGVDTYA